MTDHELLELAAKAAGIERLPPMRFEWRQWNPLIDDGDALRLAVKLRLNLNFAEWDGADFVCATPHPRLHQGQEEVMDDDENAATRRAIVRAAAEIGKATPPTKEPTP